MVGFKLIPLTTQGYSTSLGICTSQYSTITAAEPLKQSNFYILYSYIFE